MLLILIPLVWLAVAAVVVAACQTASRADGEVVASAGPAGDQGDRAPEASGLALVVGPTARGEPPRPLEQVHSAVHAPASAALSP